MIQNAVKKLLLPLSSVKGFRVLGSDKGAIEEQEYEIVIAQAGGLLNIEALEADFQKAGKILAQCVWAWPYSVYRTKESISVRLDEKEYVLVKGKHYTIPEQVQ